LAGKKIIFENGQHSLFYKIVELKYTKMMSFFSQTQYFTTIVSQARQKMATNKRVFNLAVQKTRRTWE